jgi:hypothetical protein
MRYEGEHVSQETGDSLCHSSFTFTPPLPLQLAGMGKFMEVKVEKKSSHLSLRYPKVYLDFV